jgi:predicted  nucleic acid-binding Zn-ribbon protein
MWQVAGVLGAALVMCVVSFKVYYDRAEAEKDALRIELQTAVNNQKVLESTIQDQNDRIIQAIQEQKQQQEQIQGLQEKNREAAKEVSSLRQKFARHDLNNLSLRKPGLIEKIVNKATKEVGDELAQITDPNR